MISKKKFNSCECFINRVSLGDKLSQLKTVLNETNWGHLLNYLNLTPTFFLMDTFPLIHSL